MATTTEGTPSGYSAVVRHPTVGRLIVVKTISEVGDFVGLAALLLLSYDQTGSLLGAAAVYTARALPSILVATLLGGWLDTSRRRPTLTLLAVAGAGALAIPAAVPNATNAVLAAALLGAVRVAYSAVTTAVVAESVEHSIQLPFFGLSGTINALAQVSGIAGGSALTLLVGPRTALLFDLASFLVAAALLTTVPLTGRVQRPGLLPPGAGFVLIWRQPTLRILACLTWATLVCSVLPEAVATAAARADWIPAVMAASALGGGIFIGIMGRSHFLERPLNQARTAAASGLGLLAGAVLLFSHAHPLLLVLANLTIGAASGWTVGAQATFARLAPVGRMGQIEATMLASNVVLEGVGVLALSALVVATGQDGTAYLVGGVLVFLVAVLSMRPLRALDPIDVSAPTSIVKD